MKDTFVIPCNSKYHADTEYELTKGYEKKVNCRRMHDYAMPDIKIVDDEEDELILSFQKFILITKWLGWKYFHD